LIAVLLAFERGKIVAITVPHDVLYGFDFTRYEIKDPKRSAWAQPTEVLRNVSEVLRVLVPE
jgi:hypothetical protein